ncbi:hypothetical protein SDC9_205975 [bioreactor metagenome]|uniref:Uncharacterized protein n=1 Tax=bioreactor metagenome TaxID=1076179 RepID=A0A645J556_9ZZZZ
MLDHRFKHLSSGDNGLSRGGTMQNQSLLNDGNFRKINFDAHIAAGNHNAV